MPELPEVETVARTLHEGNRESPSIVGHTVAQALVLWHKTLAAPGQQEFKRRVVGQKVRAVGRRGKYIDVKLSQDHMLVHLRMSGDLLVGKSNEPLGEHARLALWMESGLQLSFNDARKFGRVWLLEAPEEEFSKLGPEPLDEALTTAHFHAMLQARKRQVKPLLLDQSFLAGIGNIYADEALHMARIHPLAPANLLSKKQAASLLKAIRQTLNEGIRRNGASIDWVYRGGDFQNHFRVYQRTGQPCPRCGAAIERLVVGQRGTHVCPVCQPLSVVSVNL
jgi:formamidopyrimidine-DNA glycosylase